jgi:hypothetical protein
VRARLLGMLKTYEGVKYVSWFYSLFLVLLRDVGSDVFCSFFVCLFVCLFVSLFNCTFF